MREQQNKVILIGAGASVVLAAGAYLGFISPQMEQRALNQAEIASARALTSQAVTQVAALQEKEANLPDAERQARELAEKFPDRYEEAEWIDAIGRAAKGAGVTLNRVAPSAPANPDNGNVATAPAASTPELPAGAGTLPQSVTPPVQEAPDEAAYPIAVSIVEIQATAPSRRNVQAFISALESMARPLLIDQITYAGGRDATLSIKGTTFLARALTAPGTDAQ